MEGVHKRVACDAITFDAATATQTYRKDLLPARAAFDAATSAATCTCAPLAALPGESCANNDRAGVCCSGCGGNSKLRTRLLYALCLNSELLLSASLSLLYLSLVRAFAAAIVSVCLTCVSATKLGVFSPSPSLSTGQVRQWRTRTRKFLSTAPAECPASRRRPIGAGRRRIM